MPILRSGLVVLVALSSSAGCAGTPPPRTVGPAGEYMGQKIVVGRKFRVVGAGPNDPSAAGLAGVECHTAKDYGTGELTASGPGLFAGAALCGPGDELHFFAAVKVAPLDAAAGAWFAGPKVGKGATFRILALSPDGDDVNTAFIGKDCVAEEDLVPSGPGYFHGGAHCGPAAEYRTLERARVSLASMAPAASNVPRSRFVGALIQSGTKLRIDSFAADPLLAAGSPVMGLDCTADGDLTATEPGLFGGRVRCSDPHIPLLVQSFRKAAVTFKDAHANEHAAVASLYRFDGASVPEGTLVRVIPGPASGTGNPPNLESMDCYGEGSIARSGSSSTYYGTAQCGGKSVQFGAVELAIPDDQPGRSYLDARARVQRALSTGGPGATSGGTANDAIAAAAAATTDVDEWRALDGLRRLWRPNVEPVPELAAAIRSLLVRIFPEPAPSAGPLPFRSIADAQWVLRSFAGAGQNAAVPEWLALGIARVQKEQLQRAQALGWSHRDAALVHLRLAAATGAKIDELAVNLQVSARPHVRVTLKLSGDCLPLRPFLDKALDGGGGPNVLDAEVQLTSCASQKHSDRVGIHEKTSDERVVRDFVEHAHDNGDGTSTTTRTPTERSVTTHGTRTRYVRRYFLSMEVVGAVRFGPADTWRSITVQERSAMGEAAEDKNVDGSLAALASDAPRIMAGYFASRVRTQAEDIAATGRLEREASSTEAYDREDVLARTFFTTYFTMGPEAQAAAVALAAPNRIEVDDFRRVMHGASLLPALVDSSSHR